MDMETLALVLVCVVTFIVIPALIIRRIKERRRIKKAAKEAVESGSEKSKSTGTAPAKTTVSRVRTDAEEKVFEQPKETPAKTSASRVRTDPAFSEKKATEKPKPKETKPRTDMETETLLRAEKGKKDYWKCYYCGTENGKTHSRCVVCAQEKPPTGI